MGIWQKDSDMIQRIKKYIQEKKLIQKGDKLVIGVSGGADSMALLRILMDLEAEYQLTLIVVHVNHGIRKEAQQDTSFVQAFCQQHDLPVYLFVENIPLLAKQEGKSEEEMGRIFRYQCFRKVIHKEHADKIAIAHHENDQAETVLFHMLRGTDLTGLSGMAPYYVGEEGIPIIRPLLCVNREEIEYYLNQCGMTWCEDITNQDNTYARNTLRNIVLPAMKGLNAQAVTHICRLANQMEEYEAFFIQQVRAYVDENVSYTFDKKIVLNREKLLEKMPVFVQGVLYHLLCDVSKEKRDISHEHVELLYQLLSNQSGKKLNFPYGVTAFVMYEKLILWQSFDKEEVAPQEDGIVYLDAIIWDRNKDYQVYIPEFGNIVICCREYKDLSLDKDMLRKSSNKNNYTKYFNCDKIIATLCLRTQKQDDYLCINTQGNKKKISKFFKDVKIPVDKRNKIPLLAMEHEILDVVGYRRCENFQVDETTNKVLVVTYEGEEYGSN
ncbi:MAG: tRNA lysidine(34) synthetase TilS [Lachnospiraceae bacterium]